MPTDVTLMVAKTRFVVVHYHIFKNAGSSVERILDREFPGAFAKLHGPDAGSVLDGDDLAAFLNRQPNIKAITSHHLRYPLPVVRGVVLFDCCFIRHPLDRLDSVYSYFRGIESDDPLCVDARRQTPAEFVRRLIDRSPEQVSNAQVTHIANRGAFTRPANESDLARAVRTVRDMALPGVVEMFQESMTAAEYFMRPAFPSIRLGAAPANVSRRILTDAREREARLIERWGRNLYDELTRLNRLDIELFRHTGDEIRRRLSLTPRVPARVPEVENQPENQCVMAQTI